jgi:uncharacterized membrane protein (DUF485 family)
MKRFTTSLATIVLGMLFAEPLILIAFLVLTDERAPHLVHDLIWTGAIMTVGSLAAGWVLARRLVRWAWQE